MTTPSHTKLAARALKWKSRIQDRWFMLSYDTTMELGDLLEQLAAALQSPERVQGDMVLVPRVLPRHARMYLLSGEKSWATLLGLIAIPSPQAEKQPLSDEQHRAIWERESRDWAEGRNDNPYLAYGKAVERAHGIVTKEST